LLANLRVEVIGYGSLWRIHLLGVGNALSCRMSILYVTVLDPSVYVVLNLERYRVLVAIDHLTS
jgi:hypothetical protein